MTTTPRRRRRGAPTPPTISAPADPVKDRTTSILTAAVLFVIFAFVMIPVVWLLANGYRWALR